MRIKEIMNETLLCFLKHHLKCLFVTTLQYIYGFQIVKVASEQAVSSSASLKFEINVSWELHCYSSSRLLNI